MIISKQKHSSFWHFVHQTAYSGLAPDLTGEFQYPGPLFLLVPLSLTPRSAPGLTCIKYEELYSLVNHDIYILTFSSCISTKINHHAYFVPITLHIQGRMYPQWGPVRKKCAALHLKNWRPFFSHHRPYVSCQFS